MLGAPIDLVQTAAESQAELRDAVRVLGAVVEQLAERVELLETREGIRKAAGSNPNS